MDPLETDIDVKRLADALRRCLSALSDDYASANDPVLVARDGGVDWEWNLRIMCDAQDALRAAGLKPCSINQSCTAQALMKLQGMS